MHKRDLTRLILAMAEGEAGGSGGSGANGSADTPAAGGQGGSGDGGDRGGAGTGTGSSSAATGSGGHSGGGAQTGKTGKRKLEDLDQEELIALVREHRGEAADNRTKRNTAEQTLTDLQRKVAAAFGIDTDGDGKPDPDKLAADLTAAQADARMRSVELAVYRAASDKGADPGALLDSRSFLDSVADLDPASADFQTRLGDKIATATQNNPRLVVGGSSNGTGGRPGGGIGQGGRGPQSGPVGVAAGRALHQERKGPRQNSNSST